MASAESALRDVGVECWRLVKSLDFQFIPDDAPLCTILSMLRLTVHLRVTFLNAEDSQNFRAILAMAATRAALYLQQQRTLSSVDDGSTAALERDVLQVVVSASLDLCGTDLE